MSRKRSTFGTLTSGRVDFNILADQNLATRPPDWTMRLRTETYLVPGSWPPITETDIIAAEPAVVTWRIYLDTRDDYAALFAKIGTTDTLRIPYGLQSHIGETEQEHDTLYDVLHHTTLMAMAYPQFYIGGGCEVEVTFQRTIDPETGEVQA